MSLSYIESYTKWGNPPVALERANEIESFDIVVSGVVQLPDKPCYELFLQPDTADVYIGDQNLQNIKIAAGSIAILDVINSNLIWVSGATTVHVMIFR